VLAFVLIPADVIVFDLFVVSVSKDGYPEKAT